jgi:hypothetical protein
MLTASMTPDVEDVAPVHNGGARDPDRVVADL